MEATECKSKLKHLVETSYDNTLNTLKQQPYLNTNNRGECSAIFSTRTLMLKVKENYSSKNVDKSCQFCKTQESETQTHILEKCKEFETETKYIDQHHLKKATEHITKIEAKQIPQIKNQNQRHGQDKNPRSDELKSSGITDRAYNRQETIDIEPKRKHPHRTQKKESI